MSKFKVGDKAIKVKGYEFPCTIVSVFETKAGNVRVVGEMDNYGLLHIFNEGQLEHPEEVGQEQGNFAKPVSEAEVTPIPKGVITKPQNL